MISVVMASYNGEQFIVEQLESIRNQTRVPDEVIICDDSSKDNTVSVVQSYIEKNSLKGWSISKNKDNIGYYENFFKAIKLARGDIIFLADQDDIWDLNKVETFEKLYMNRDIMMIQSDVIKIDAKGNKIDCPDDYHQKWGAVGIVPLDTVDICKFAGSGYTMTFRKCVTDVIFDNCLNKEKEVFLFHDILIGYMAAALGECLLCKNIKDKHRLHKDNVTQTFGHRGATDRTKQKQISIVERRIKMFDIFKSIDISDDKKEIYGEFRDFAQKRKELLERFSIRKSSRVFRLRRLYYSKWGFASDVLYSLGLEKIVRRFL